MKNLAVIPARRGSKAIPDKNLKTLGGKPLIAYIIETALKSEYLDRIIVSTEDEKIAEIAREYGAEVPFIRPKELAEDDVLTIPYVFRHAVEELKRSEGLMPENKKKVAVFLEISSNESEVQQYAQANGLEILYSFKRKGSSAGNRTENVSGVNAKGQ